MAIGGQRPKSTVLRLVGGNAGKRPIPANDPMARVSINKYFDEAERHVTLDAFLAPLDPLPRLDDGAGGDKLAALMPSVAGAPEPEKARIADAVKLIRE